MYRVLHILSDEEIGECRKIAEATPFVDGKITNPHMSAKNNEQLHDHGAYERSSAILRGALLRSLPWREAGIIDTVLPAASPPGPFARLGNIIPLALGFAFLLAAIALARRGRYRKT